MLRIAAILVPAILVACSGLSSGHAQGFFENLFGLSQPAPRPIAPHAYRTPLPTPRFSDPAELDMRKSEPTGHYRTVCVRMCDGYYFPVSASVSRNAFNRDAGICRASCGTEARLFYQDASSTDAATMVDLSGRSYTSHPQAFRYRKTLVDGCKCKPDPWAQSEKDRHLSYAMEQRRQYPMPAPAPQATTVAAASSVPVSEPEPVDVRTTPIAPAPRAITRVAETTSPRPERSNRRSRKSPSPQARAHPAAEPVKVATSSPPKRAKTRPTGLVGLGAPKMRWPGD